MKQCRKIGFKEESFKFHFSLPSVNVILEAMHLPVRIVSLQQLFDKINKTIY